MHHALQIREVLANIFSYLEQKKDLASSLLACRLFFEVAVAPLYESLESSTLQSVIRGLLASQTRHRPVYERLTTFRRYARCVRHIQLPYKLGPKLNEDADDLSDDDDDDSRTEPPVYISLRRALILASPESLFQNLRTLSVHAPSGWCLDIVSMLLVPTLEELSLRVLKYSSPGMLVYDGAASVPLSAALEKLPQRCSLLRTLHIGIHCITSVQLSSVLATVITNSQHLTTMECETNAVDACVVHALAMHPHLQHLRIDLPSDPHLCIPDVLEYPESFRNLQTLEVSGLQEDIVELLPLLSKDLRSLEISVTSFSFVQGALRKIADLIQSQFTDLEAVLLRLLDMSLEEGLPVEPWSLDSIEALLTYSSLHRFKFECSYPYERMFDLQDKHVLTMARAWPKLKTLSVQWGCNDLPHIGLQNNSGLTMRAIHHLADNCPSLTELEFTWFDASYSPSMYPSLAPNCNLVKLAVFWPTKAAVPGMVAVFLSLLWPYLRIEIGDDLGGSPPGMATWQEVVQSVKCMGIRYALEHEEPDRVRQVYEHLGLTWGLHSLTRHG